MGVPKHEPTRKEIRAECWLIQDEWSEDERQKRAGHCFARVEWELPRMRNIIEGLIAKGDI